MIRNSPTRSPVECAEIERLSLTSRERSVESTPWSSGWVRAIPTYADPRRFPGSYGRRCEHIKKDNDVAEVRITNSEDWDISRDSFVSLETPGPRPLDPEEGEP